MDERNIVLTVRGDVIERSSNHAGTQHEGNASTITFNFDRTWDGYAKTVTFWDAHGLNPVKIVLGESVKTGDREYTVTIPAEPMKVAGNMAICIDGAKENARQRATQTTMEVSASMIAVAPDEVTPTVAEQLQADIDTVQGNFETHAADTDIHVTAEKQTAWTAKYDKPSSGIPTADIADDAVTMNKIRDRAIVGVKIADNAVMESKIRDEAVTTSKLKDGAVTRAKFADAVKQELDGKANEIEVIAALTGKADTATVNAALATKQNNLNTAQLAAADSGITTEKVSSYDAHVANDAIHVTAADKANWNGKADRNGEESITVNAENTAANITVFDNAGELKTIIRHSGIETPKVSGLAEIADNDADDVAAPKGYVDRKLTEVANIEDGKLESTSVWSSKKTVDALCQPINKTGTFVTCYPIEDYPMTVQSTGTKVYCGGKNLLDKSVGSFRISASSGSLKYGAESTSNIAACVPNHTYRISIIGKPKRTVFRIGYVNASLSELNALSRGGSATIPLYAANLTADSTGATLTVGSDATYIFVQSNTTSFEEDTLALQVEFGNETTDYEAYKGFMSQPVVDGVATIPATIAGENVYAADDGQTITVTGREDPQHTINELKQAIISLGGNV